MKSLFRPLLSSWTRNRAPRLTRCRHRFQAGWAGLAVLGLTSGAMGGGIGNLVFKDGNGNRFFDYFGSDEVVPGVQVFLCREGFEPLDEGAESKVTTTDSFGQYYFANVPDGRYYVFIPPTAFTSGPLNGTKSVPGTLGAGGADDDAGEDGIDSAQPTVDGVRTGIVELTAGRAPVSYDEGEAIGTETGSDSGSDDFNDEDSDLTVDLGFQEFTTRIGDFVWEDTNRDGLQDPGEPGLAGVPVNLYDAGNANVGTTTTAADGFYTFITLPAGSYSVRFPATHGTFKLTTAELDPADLRDSDAHVATGRTPLYELSAMSTQNNVDAGYVVDLPDIGGFIFNDLDANGIQDAGEDGIPDVTVRLYTEAGDLADSTESVGGYYTFPSVTPGRYYLNFPLVAEGLVLSMADQSGEETTDSDPDPATGNTPVFEAVAAADDSSWFAGYHAPPASIAGVAWRDLDRDGVRDAGEPVLPGVDVALRDAATGEVFDFTVTDGQGAYRFEGLTSQDWLVQFPVYAGLDNRYQLTLANAVADESVDSDASTGNGFTDAVTPLLGEEMNLDAGYRNVPLGLGNAVFRDLDQNGFFSSTYDAAAVGVRVELFAGGDDPLTDGPRAFMLTGDGGFYRFDDLLPGPYFVRIPPSEFQSGGPLAGWISMPGNGLDNGLDDNVDENGLDAVYPAESGIVSTVAVLVPGGEPRSGIDHTERGAGNTGDDSDDSHIDLTLDLSFTPGMTIGNLVFTDRDGDGGYDSGEGVAGVSVELFLSAPPVGREGAVGSVVTDADGFYQFRGLESGEYKVHLPAANFQAGGPLAGARSMPGHGTSFNVDDGLDENGIDDEFPHVNGITSPAFTLVHGSAPTAAQGETGAGSTSDDAAVGGDGNGLLTVDFGFNPGLPPTYADWRQRFLPAGANSPSQDADGDGLPNGYEYLYHLPPTGGPAVRQPLKLTADPDSGILEAVLVFNPLATASAPVLTTRADLRDGVDSWQAVTAITPVDTLRPDGLLERRWNNLEAIPSLADGTGFLRATAGLDTDDDSVPDLTFHTPVLGWHLRRHPAGMASSGSAFLRPPVFRGTVDSAAGPALTLTTSAGGEDLSGSIPAGTPFYAEITGGAYAGHRFEIDEAATSGAVLRLLAASPLHTRTVPDLSGAPLVVRAHWTLNSLFPPGQFHATTDPATADQILTYPRPSFAGYFLLRLGDDVPGIWVRTDDNGLADAGNRPVPPGEGLFVDCRGPALEVLDLGEVRPHRMARVLTAGSTLLTSGWPVPGTPASWALRQADGFTGSPNPAAADTLQLWRADVTGAQKAFQSFFLLHAAAPYRYWADKSDPALQSRDAETLFSPGRAVFLQLRATVPNSYEPCPWTP